MANSQFRLSSRISNRRFGYVLGIVVSFVVIAGTMAQQVYAWQLQIYLDNPPFGVDRAEVTVEGPFGWYQNDYWATGPPPLIASYNVPGNEIPDGYQYQVCVGAGYFTLGMNCQFFTHNSGDESVRMSLAGT